MKLVKAPLMLLCCSALVWAACTKGNGSNSSTPSVSNTALTAQGDASSDAAFNDVTTNVMTTNANGQDIGSVDDSTSSFRQAMARGHMAGVTTFGPDSTSGTVTFTITPETPGVFPKTVTINFGSGFTDIFGNVYTGSISTVFTGRLDSIGASATTTFNNYSVDSIGLSGTHEITNTSVEGQQIAYSVKVTDAKLTFPGGYWVSWGATRNWVMTAGASTPRWPFDDVYSLTGSGGGSTSNNFSWTSTVETPLVRAYVCPWFESGSVKVTCNFGTGVLDYGAGTCDNQATVTVGDSTRAIILGR